MWQSSARERADRASPYLRGDALTFISVTGWMPKSSSTIALFFLSTSILA
jgi:hypothetical protein